MLQIKVTPDAQFHSLLATIVSELGDKANPASFLIGPAYCLPAACLFCCCLPACLPALSCLHLLRTRLAPPSRTHHRSALLHLVAAVATSVARTRACLGLLSLCFLVPMDLLNARLKLKVPIPYQLVLVVLVTGLSHAADFHARWGVKVPYRAPGSHTCMHACIHSRSSALLHDSVIVYACAS